MGTQPKQRYIKRIPLTCGLMLVSLLGFTASLDFNKIVDDYLFKNISGNSDNGKAMAFAFGGCTIYLIIGLVAILAIALIWRGIADWPLNQN
jgi:hypothetical protein